MIADGLQRVLTAHLGSPVRLLADPEPISGGFWASIYGFELQPERQPERQPGQQPGQQRPAEWSGRLVLRVMPVRERAEHEIIVQRSVAEAGFPTPPVLCDGFDDELGGAFMVMPFSRGKSPMTGLGVGSLLSLPRILRRLPVQLAEVAIRLHAIDPAPIAAALAEAGMASTGDGAESRLAAIRAAAATTESDGFERLLGWFLTHRPRHPKLVMCHGDLHPFNLLIDDSETENRAGDDETVGGGRTTVLDWTNGDLLPREFDVGFTAGFLRCAPIEVPKFAEPAMRRLTRWLANRFVATYARSAPLDPQMLAWFEALQYGRCLAEVATARSGLSHVVGEKHPFETSAAAMGRRLEELTGITVVLPPRRRLPAS